MLKHAHRQIHAEDAGSAAGRAGSCFAGQSSGNHERAFSFRASEQGDGITRPLLEKIGANVDQLRAQLRSELERRPKIHGAAADVRLSNELRSVLDNAEKEMAKLKDEFISAEHYLLALPGRKFLRQNY